MFVLYEATHLILINSVCHSFVAQQILFYFLLLSAKLLHLPCVLYIILAQTFPHNCTEICDEFTCGTCMFNYTKLKDLEIMASNLLLNEYIYVGIIIKASILSSYCCKKKHILYFVIDFRRRKKSSSRDHGKIARH